jgi:hypothetical protein
MNKELKTLTFATALMAGLTIYNMIDKKLAVKRMTKFANILGEELNGYEEGTQTIEVNMKDIFKKSGCRTLSKTKKNNIVNIVAKHIVEEQSGYGVIVDNETQILTIEKIGA